MSREEKKQEKQWADSKTSKKKKGFFKLVSTFLSSLFASIQGKNAKSEKNMPGNADSDVSEFYRNYENDDKHASTYYSEENDNDDNTEGQNKSGQQDATTASGKQNKKLSKPLTLSRISWWKLIILIIEIGLIAYTILVLTGFAPLF